MASSLTFAVGDAGTPDLEPQQFDVVSCIGATWIAGGLDGTLRLMAQWVTPGGWLLVGEPFWIEVPDPNLRASVEVGQGFADLAGTLDRFEATGLDLVEMVLSDTSDWDRVLVDEPVRLCSAEERRVEAARLVHPRAAETGLSHRTESRVDV